MKLKNLFRSAKAAALVEYGMLVGLIAVLAIVAVNNLGSTVRDTFTQVSDTLSGSLASATANPSSSGSIPAEEPSFVQNDAVIAFSFTAGFWMASTDERRGFASDDGLSIPVTMIVGDVINLERSEVYTYQRGSGSSITGLRNMYIGLRETAYPAASLAGYRYICDNGFNESLDDASASVFPGGITLYTWTELAQPFATMSDMPEGVEYTCQVVPAA